MCVEYIILRLVCAFSYHLMAWIIYYPTRPRKTCRQYKGMLVHVSIMTPVLSGDGDTLDAVQTTCYI